MPQPSWRLLLDEENAIKTSSAFYQILLPLQAPEAPGVPSSRQTDRIQRDDTNVRERCQIAAVNVSRDLPFISSVVAQAYCTGKFPDLDTSRNFNYCFRVRVSCNSHDWKTTGLPNQVKVNIQMFRIVLLANTICTDSQSQLNKCFNQAKGTLMNLCQIQCLINVHHPLLSTVNSNLKSHYYFTLQHNDL